MGEISSQDKILDHIGHVRDWLDRAEKDYQNDATWLGELNLNLAQAELKKAHEESQRMHLKDKVIYLQPTPAEQKQKVEYPRGEGVRWIKYRRLSKSRTSMVAVMLLLILVSISSIFGLGGRLTTEGRMEKVFVQDESITPLVQPSSDLEERPVASKEPVLMNQLAYNQVSLASGKGTINSSREVYQEASAAKVGMEIPQIEVNYQPTRLVSGKLTSANSGVKSRFAEQNTSFDQLTTDPKSLPKSRSLTYDLESLIQLAEDELYVKK